MLETAESKTIAEVESLKRELRKFKEEKKKIDAWVKAKQDERDKFIKEEEKIRKALSDREVGVKKAETSIAEQKAALEKLQKATTEESAKLIETRNQAGARVQEANSKLSQLEKRINTLTELEKRVDQKMNKWHEIVKTVEGLK